MLLTEKQSAILAYMKHFFSEKGCVPSVRQIGGSFSISARAVQQHIVALQKKGALVHRVPDSAAYAFAEKSSLATFAIEEQSTVVPLLGEIAAGAATESFGRDEQNIALTASFFSKTGAVFAVIVSGDSMIGDAICDGDVAMIEKCCTWDPADIVAVRVDGDAFTLKRLRPCDGEIELLPSNPAYTPTRLSSDRIEVVGRYVGLMRSY